MAQVKQIDQNQDNNQQNEQQQAQPQTLAGSTQSSSPSPSSGRIANFSSGSQPQASGRFTNLQKYMDANKSATGNLGARANQTINKGFNQGQTELEKSNQQIAENYGKGRQTIDTQGSQYKNQLGQIGQNLGSFQSFDNRGQFDQAGQQAQALAQDTNYQNLSSGSAVDQNALTASQQAALGQAQGLLDTAKTNLGNIQTEQGRDILFSQVLQPKQGYSTGQRSFDKLFLGGALGGIQQNLQGKQTLANELLKGTNLQGTNVNQLISDEAALLGDLSKQNLANQDLFNTKLNTQENIDYVNNLRNQRFQNVLSGLQAGNISKDVADQLGLSNANTYINQNQPGQTGAQAQKNLIGTYNLLKDPTALNKYIQQGANASSFQDIVGQQDFDTYKALQALSGRDTGQLAGVSQLGSAVRGNDQLAKDIATADKAFRDQYAGKEAFGQGTSYRADAQYAKFGTPEYWRNQQNLAAAQSGINAVAGAGLGNAQSSQVLANQLNPLVQNRGLYGTGSVGTAQTNIDDYIRNNAINQNTSSQFWDQGGGAKETQDRLNESAAAARDNLTNYLNNIINTTGVKNALTVDETIDPLTQRFKGLL